MISSPTSPEETRRLDALTLYAVEDLLPDAAFQELTELAAQICNAPAATISILDGERQWSMSRFGFAPSEIERRLSFCNHAIQQSDILIVPDATCDERFAENPLVVGEPFVRFYAGMPLMVPEGVALGALCVFDNVPRELSDAQKQTLRVLSRQVVGQLRLRRHLHELESNITERKHLEEQLRHSQKMEGIGQLASGVAHDFNNLLTVIQGNASLLLLGDSGEHVAESAQQIVQAVERAAALTQQLLLFSRKQRMQQVELDLNAVVENMTKMLHRILGEDIALTTELASRLPLVRADAGMIEQVLLNLAVNSRDAMPAGGHLRISTSAETVNEKQAQENPDATPGPCVCLRVSDNGPGIPPEILPHIFEPFFTTKEAGKGTGLGLATVYGIVKQHRGWLAIESGRGKGATICVYLLASSPGEAGRPRLRSKAASNVSLTPGGT
jgi:signal transduction histidine kinase